MNFFQQKNSLVDSQNRALNLATRLDNSSKRLSALKLEISMHYLMRFLITIIISLFALSVGGQILKYTFSYIRPDGEDKLFIRLFDLNTENNVPSLFSVGLLFVCCILLGIIAMLKYQQRERFRGHWKWLSLIFLGLSIDEGASIHEELIIPLRSGLGVSGFLYFAWVIPAFLFVLFLGITYLKFILALPKQIRTLFILSGGIYLSGTIGLELIGGVIASTTGSNNLLFTLISSCEEVTELTGILLFVYTLLKYLQLNINSIQLRFK